MILFISGVIEHYKTSLEFFPNYLIQLLDNYADQLNPKIRLKIIIALIAVRNKDLLEPTVSIPAFLKLL